MFIHRKTAMQVEQMLIGHMYWLSLEGPGKLYI